MLATVTALPPALDLTCAQSLRAMVRDLLARNELVLDAGEVERVSTPCVQVLLAAGRAAVRSGAAFKIHNASDAFRAAIADLGLQPEFTNWID